MDTKRTLHTEEFLVELAAHVLWQATDGREGEKADFSNCIIEFKASDITEKQRKDAFYMVTGVCFDGAVMKDCEFEHFTFRNCSMKNTDLSGSSFNDCVIDYCDLTADRSQIDRDKPSGLDDTTFYDCTLSNLTAPNISISRSTMIATFLAHNHFDNCTLNYLTLKETTVFDNDFSETTLSYTICGKNTRFTFCKFINAKMLKSDYRGADFDESKILGGNIYMSSFNDAKMNGITFEGTDIVDTNFEETLLSPDVLPWLHKSTFDLTVGRSLNFRVPYCVDIESGRILSEQIYGVGKGEMLKSFQKRAQNGELAEVCMKKLMHNYKFNSINKFFTRHAIQKVLIHAAKEITATVTACQEMKKALDKESQK